MKPWKILRLAARPIASGIALAVLSGLLSPCPARAQTEQSAAAEEIVVFIGATLHPVSGAPVEDGRLLVEGGVITAVGPEVSAPAGAEVVDLTGKHLYPGFVHAGSALGLVEVASVPGTVDTSEAGEVNAALRAEIAFNADSALLPVSLSGGVVAALVMPQGGLIAGRSAVMSLEGWTWEEMTLRAPAGMHVRFPRFAPRRFGRPENEEKAKKKREKDLETLTRTFEEARAYHQARRASDLGKAPSPARRPHLEALGPVLDGELPLFLHAGESTQIEAALDWIEKHGLTRVILVSRTDAARHAERLVEKGIPVILQGAQGLPGRDWEPYDHAYTAAARLHEAGVTFAIADGGSGFGAANARNLPFHAAMAVAFGLPRDVALRAITLGAAEILGVADRLGSLEPGKHATFLVTDGDPLEIRTKIEQVWVGGRRLDLENTDRQRRLYRKYRDRP